MLWRSLTQTRLRKVADEYLHLKEGVVSSRLGITRHRWDSLLRGEALSLREGLDVAELFSRDPQWLLALNVLRDRTGEIPRTGRETPNDLQDIVNFALAGTPAPLTLDQNQIASQPSFVLLRSFNSANDLNRYLGAWNRALLERAKLALRLKLQPRKDGLLGTVANILGLGLEEMNLIWAGHKAFRLTDILILAQFCGVPADWLCLGEELRRNFISPDAMKQLDKFPVPRTFVNWARSRKSVTLSTKPLSNGDFLRIAEQDLAGSNPERDLLGYKEIWNPFVGISISRFFTREQNNGISRMTQNQTAKLLGISDSTLSQIKAGFVTLSLDRARALSSYYQVPLAELLPLNDLRMKVARLDPKVKTRDRAFDELIAFARSCESNLF